jgi:hypothetical protein
VTAVLRVRNEPSGHVGSAVERLLRFDDRLQFVLVAVLDSTPDLVGSPSLASYWREGLASIGTQVLASRSVAERMLGDGSLFRGFDEAWMFHDRPAIPRPAGSVITTDVESLADPDGLERWMRTTNAQIGVGDGIGLRIVALESESTDALMDILTR